MKKNIIKYLSFVFAFFLCVSCRSNKSSTIESTSQIEPEIKSLVQVVSNHSFLTTNDIGNSFTIKGKLLKNDSNWILIENPTSRSRVTFVLDVPSSLNDVCVQKVNTIVTVSGILTDVKSAWGKSLSVKAVD